LPRGGQQQQQEVKPALQHRQHMLTMVMARAPVIAGVVALAVAAVSATVRPVGPIMPLGFVGGAASAGMASGATQAAAGRAVAAHQGHRLQVERALADASIVPALHRLRLAWAASPQARILIMISTATGWAASERVRVLQVAATRAIATAAVGPSVVTAIGTRIMMTTTSAAATAIGVVVVGVIGIAGTVEAEALDANGHRIALEAGRAASTQLAGRRRLRVAWRRLIDRSCAHHLPVVHLLSQFQFGRERLLPNSHRRRWPTANKCGRTKSRSRAAAR